MRFPLPLGRRLFLLVAFLFALVALLPLRLALDGLGLSQRGMAAREVVGSVWGGGLRGAQYRDLELGDVDAELGIAPLLLARARLALRRHRTSLASAAGDQDRFEGAVTVSRNSFALSDLSGRIALGAALAPLPISRIDLSDVTARFVGGLCTTASGLVTVEIAGAASGVPLPASMSGNARCDGGALLLPLAGASGMEQLALRIAADGSYRATLTVRPSDTAMAQRLATGGFTAADGALRLSIDGQLE